MNDKLVDFLIEKTEDFGSVIDELAKQMGVAAEHIYEVIVRQQYVEGISGLIGSGLFFIFAIILMIVSLKSRKRLLNEGYADGSDMIAFRWIGIVISFIIVIVVLFTTIAYLKMLLNPEFYALKDIMELIRGELSN